MDILFTSYNEYPYALMYFTGSKSFNIYMRKLCAEKGLKLNEKTLTKNKKKITENIKSEGDIFNFLNISYLEPSKRYK